MYIFGNAVKSITRNKGRNVLIGIVVLVIAVSACVALSIRQAAETAKEETLSGMSVTAQISFDRSSAMSEMMKDSSGTQEGFDPSSFDKSKLQGDSLTLDEYLSYTDALGANDSYYYTATASLDASGDLNPYSTEDSTDSSETTESTENEAEQNGMPSDFQGGDFSGGKGGFSAVTQGDFSISGYSSYDAMLSLFGEDGSCSISDGSMFDEDTDEAVCVISDELAMYNNLSVGDEITLANPNYSDETYTLTICGIYTNSSSDQGNSMFSQNDPANNIYMSYNTLKAITDASASAGNTYTDDSDSEVSAALGSELNFTYVFANTDDYYSFEDKVYDLGLSDQYTVSSQDLSSFENSMTPLETLSSMAGWFFLIVLIVGGIILVVINIFSLRERKYEVGVLTAIGMKKSKVALQFISEMFMITFAAIVIGSIIGACISLPVTNTLLSNQISSASSSSEQLNSNFGFSGDSAPTMPGAGNMDSSRFNKGGMSGMSNMPGSSASYIDSVSSATNIYVILELIGVGLFLTLISSLAAMITIMRYEPLKILSSRS